MFLPTLIFTLALLSLTSASHSPSLNHKRAHNRLVHNHTRDIQARATLPSGWSLYVVNGNDGGGCYVDTLPRVLPDFTVGDGGNGITKCVNLCAGKNYKYAGVENGNECYCSNSVNPLQAVPRSECGVSCLDNSGEKCGGSWRLNIYSKSTPAPAVSWSYVGCTRDSDTRLLPLQYTSSSMSIRACLASCAQIGATYGGVEFGSECYCGTSVKGGSSLSESECSVACNGGGSTQCGGSWALSLWKAGSASTPSASPSPSPSPSTIPVGWNYLFCATDGDPRGLNEYVFSDSSMTVNKCLAACANKGYKIGGVEDGNECHCGNKLTNNQGKQAPESECTKPCNGDGAWGKCGGGWRMSLFSSLTGDALASAIGKTVTATQTTTVQTTSSLTTTTTTTAPVQTTPASGSYTPTTNIPGSGTKYLWAHFIVGNAYAYTTDTWKTEIATARDAGVDGFILNMGSSSWQPARIRDAYNAAGSSGFKMMLSFDMAEFGCGDGNYINLFQQYLSDFLTHPAAAKIEGKSAVTTFMGQDCSFGQGSTNAGWSRIFGNNANNIYFMPAYTNDPREFKNYNIQAQVNWGSAWPVGASDIDTERDRYFIGLLSAAGKKYVGTVSPVFAAHMSYKNWIWRSDNWLMAKRWEDLISLRDQVDQVEMVTWNDYGESDYFGPLLGDMPDEVRYYVNENFVHHDCLSLNAFYAQAWKTGRWPTITQDKVWIMARPHAQWATATSGGIVPDYRQFTSDNFYAQVHLTAAASVVLCAGGTCSTKAGQPGINRFQQPLVPGQGMRVQVIRNGQTTVNLSPSYTFSATTAKYNFNYLIKSS